MKKNSKIILGVGSSISIYKSCEIIRLLQKKDFEIQVIMTKNATRLISPLLLGALSRNKCLVDLFEEEDWEKISHVALARDCSLLIVAPATANIIAKFKAGLADDFLSTFYLAARCPVLIAPAMNEAMYLHKQTQENLDQLKKNGITIVPPEDGYLACQDSGPGRLASPEKIVQEALGLLQKSRKLEGKTVLVTAGPTREYMDPVRFISNRSSGKMGFALAEEALRRGASVILVSGPTELIPPRGANYHPVQTAQEMVDKVSSHFKKAQVLIMAAAVSDFRFPDRSSSKIKKKSFSRKVEFELTPDILESLKSKKGKRTFVGFAAETENIFDNAMRKIKEKNLDFIVANDISQKDIGFASDYNKVHLIFPGGRVIKTKKLLKREISQILFNEIEALIEQKKS